MTKDDLISYIRLHIDDMDNAPYLVSDNLMQILIADAEKEAAERALYLKLLGTCDLAVVFGTNVYQVASEIIFIDRAKLKGQPQPLIKTTQKEIDFNYRNWESVIGLPTYYWLENDYLTLYPSPDKSYSLSLEGFRRPITDMETPPHLRRSLAYWVAYLVYMMPDLDKYNPGKAKESEDLFTKAFGPKRSAKFDELWRNGVEFSPLYKTQFQVQRESTIYF